MQDVWTLEVTLKSPATQSMFDKNECFSLWERRILWRKMFLCLLGLLFYQSTIQFKYMHYCFLFTFFIFVNRAFLLTRKKNKKKSPFDSTCFDSFDKTKKLSFVQSRWMQCATCARVWCDKMWNSLSAKVMQEMNEHARAHIKINDKCVHYFYSRRVENGSLFLLIIFFVWRLAATYRNTLA